MFILKGLLYLALLPIVAALMVVLAFMSLIPMLVVLTAAACGDEKTADKFEKYIPIVWVVDRFT